MKPAKGPLCAQQTFRTDRDRDSRSLRCPVAWKIERDRLKSRMDATPNQGCKVAYLPFPSVHKHHGRTFSGTIDSNLANRPVDPNHFSAKQRLPAGRRRPPCWSQKLSGDFRGRSEFTGIHYFPLRASL